jgi:hypothetical protein
MRKHLLLCLLCLCVPLVARSQVLEFSSLNTRKIEKLDRSKTVVVVPGGILEEHGRIFQRVLMAFSISGSPTTWRLSLRASPVGPR